MRIQINVLAKGTVFSVENQRLSLFNGYISTPNGNEILRMNEVWFWLLSLSNGIKIMKASCPALDVFTTE